MSAIRRPLVILLAATTVSAAGTAVTQLAVPWLVLQDTGNARDAGVVALCTMVPAGVSALASGGTVGRASWRRVSLVSDLACALAVGAIPLLQLAGGLDFWLLCALMATAGSCHAPGDTARALALPQLAQRAGVALPRAAGYYSGAARAAAAAGAAAGGVLIATLGASHVLAVDAGSFAASALLIAVGLRGAAGLPARPPDAHSAPSGSARWRDFGLGLRLVAGTPLLLAITVTALLAQTLDQGWSAVLLPIDVRDKLHSVVALGAAETAFALCALIGALGYGALGDRAARWPVFVLAFAIVGMPRFAVAAGTASAAPLVAMMAIEGLACGPLNPITSTVVYETVPVRLRGPTIGTMTALSLLIPPLGALAAGLLVGALGLFAATVLFGAVYLLVTLVPAVLPVYRQLTAHGPAGGRSHDLPRAWGADGAS